VETVAFAALVTFLVACTIFPLFDDRNAR